ncbi:MAG: putative manganese transporter [Lachnospiraceae bacterium]|nr:putative manganese transporter [Lachnospiraceae bacterium]
MTIFIDALIDSLFDTLKLIPFLFITYLLMEYLEHHTASKITGLLARMGKAGPLFGGLFGIVPQCGFSASAASLYSGGVITLGTMLAVFLSTSDEMLPIFISEQVAPTRILSILGTKAVFGIISGLLVDAVLRHTRWRDKGDKNIHDLCIEEHADYESDEKGGILRAALTHTVNIVIFIFVITLVLTLLVDAIGQNRIASFLNAIPILGVFLAALIGLIPNCGASVALTQLYLAGMMSVGQMMAGLLVGAGVGLLVLFRTNHHHLRENIKITVLLYCIGVLWGIILELIYT